MNKYVYVNKEMNEFHLTNGKISYIFRVMEQTNVMEQLYVGKAIRHREAFSYLIEREIRPSNNQVTGDHTTSLEHVKQEMPVFGTTDFRYPALEVRYPEGDRISQFEYQFFRIEEGKTQVVGNADYFCRIGRSYDTGDHFKGPLLGIVFDTCLYDIP